MRLAARRTSPPEAAGRWELPGGKVEPGEPASAAVVREVAEELGCDVEVVGWFDGAAPIGDTLELRVALARIVAGEPAASEHDALRWVDAEELHDLDWLEPDRPFLPALHVELVRAATDRRRAVLFEEEHAEAVARRLREDGFDAEVVRERLAGEDDDEDHPWAVLTDAPSFHVEVLVDEHDGWLDEPEEQRPTGQGSVCDLPTAPKRIKRPDA